MMMTTTMVKHVVFISHSQKNPHSGTRILHPCVCVSVKACALVMLFWTAVAVDNIWTTLFIFSSFRFGFNYFLLPFLVGWWWRRLIRKDSFSRCAFSFISLFFFVVLSLVYSYLCWCSFIWWWCWVFFFWEGVLSREGTLPTSHWWRGFSFYFIIFAYVGSYMWSGFWFVCVEKLC